MLRPWAVRRAFELHLSLGKPRITARIHALNSALKARLADVRGVELVTPVIPELSAGFTFFRIAGATRKPRSLRTDGPGTVGPSCC